MRILKHSVLLLVTSLKTALSSDSVTMNLRGNNVVTRETNGSRILQQEREQTRPCTVVAVAALSLGDDELDADESFGCELSSEDTGGIAGQLVRIEASPAQLQAMRNKLESGELISGVSTFHNENARISSEGRLKIPPGLEIAFEKKKSHRNLVTLQGDKPVLAVKVNALDKSVPYSSTAISDDIFGTYNDPVNLKTQLAGCSMGKLNIVNSYSRDISEHLEAPGVISVNINLNLQGNDRYTIRNAVTAAVQTKLGFNLPGPFQQVMYILEGCYTDCGWAAYAYINSWNSVYQGVYYLQTGVQIHEFGHNFGLAHSGMGSANYADHTCMMGNPLYSDDVGRMCYNPAKNWQIGWYDDRKEIVDPQVTNYWRGNIVGIADYLNNPLQFPVVVKIETGTTTDYFVGFNRAIGVNADNDLCDNCVTIIQSGSNGEGYSQSWNLINPSGGLLSGGIYTFSNWQGSGDDLTITVNSIDLNTNPGFADVTIARSGFPTVVPTPSPTATPTNVPTPLPTNQPTPSPTATPTQAPTLSPTAPPTNAPTASPTTSPTSSPTATPTTSPTPVPTDPPTPSPTATPTTSPTPVPTDPPTSSPTAFPTNAPTPFPTNPPTPFPTVPPTNCPVCGNGEECCAPNACEQNGKPSRRRCIIDGPAPPPPEPTASPPPSPTACPFCSETGEACCGTCRTNGPPSKRGCV